MDYLANYPCSIESVPQIEKQLWQKSRNILGLNLVSIRVLQVLETRSRISKPTCDLEVTATGLEPRTS